MMKKVYLKQKSEDRNITCHAVRLDIAASVS
jgi:hypothetical protein